MSVDPRTRAEIKEHYEARKVADNIRAAVRAAEAADDLQRKRPAWQPEEDEHGFIRADNYHIKGSPWQAEGAEVDGERWSWLHGEVS